MIHRKECQSCGEPTQHNKPYCLNHIHLMPRAKMLIGMLGMRRKQTSAICESHVADLVILRLKRAEHSGEKLLRSTLVSDVAMEARVRRNTVGGVVVALESDRKIMLVRRSSCHSPVVVMIHEACSRI